MAKSSRECRDGLVSGNTGVYLSKRPHFLLVYWSNNARGMVGEHKKSL